MMLPFHTPEDAERAAPAVRAHLEKGGLLGYPTETVYGLGSAAEPGAVARLAALKGRRAGKPFLLLVASRAMAEQARVISESIPEMRASMHKMAEDGNAMLMKIDARTEKIERKVSHISRQLTTASSDDPPSDDDLPSGG